MKIIILSIIICSALHGNCQNPFTKNVEYNTWAECMMAGTHDTLTLYQVMGDEYINKHKVFIKYQCTEKIKEEEKIDS
tara:strand:- start:1878 stop:2111 length:234 start_codon:yes stop_codon:yes gene_type:complete